MPDKFEEKNTANLIKAKALPSRKNLKPPIYEGYTYSDGVDTQEIARVLHADGTPYKMGTLVYGRWEEIEKWCEDNDMWVDRYLDHVAPMKLQNQAEYVGGKCPKTGKQIGYDPFAVSMPIYNYTSTGTIDPDEPYVTFHEKW